MTHKGPEGQPVSQADLPDCGEHPRTTGQAQGNAIAFSAVKPPRFLKGNDPLSRIEMLQRYQAGRNCAHC